MDIELSDICHAIEAATPEEKLRFAQILKKLPIIVEMTAEEIAAFNAPARRVGWMGDISGLGSDMGDVP